MLGCTAMFFRQKKYCPTILSNILAASATLWVTRPSLPPARGCEWHAAGHLASTTLGSDFFFYCFEAELSRGFFWKVHLRSMFDSILFSPTKKNNALGNSFGSNSIQHVCLALVNYFFACVKCCQDLCDWVALVKKATFHLPSLEPLSVCIFTLSVLNLIVLFH